MEKGVIGCPYERAHRRKPDSPFRSNSSTAGMSGQHKAPADPFGCLTCACHHSDFPKPSACS